MHNIYDCVDSFTSLLDTEYHLILGRKGISASLNISFDKKDCFHLIGLQYLADRPELRRDRGKIFDEIKERKITKEQIESSDLYGKIAERVGMLPFLEELFDSNETVFKYNQRANAFSMIQADYLMKNKIIDRMSMFFCQKIREINTSAVLFSRRQYMITPKTRLHGPCCIKKKSKWQKIRRTFCMID